MVGAKQSLEGSTSSITVSQLKHELRTPINHIVGYSEIMIEDLQDLGEARALAKVQRVHAIGKELVSMIDSTVPSLEGVTTIPIDVLSTLRVNVQLSVREIHEMDLMSTVVSGSSNESDVKRILSAAARLEAFAESGRICNSE